MDSKLVSMKIWDTAGQERFVEDTTLLVTVQVHSHLHRVPCTKGKSHGNLTYGDVITANYLLHYENYGYNVFKQYLLIAMFLSLLVLLSVCVFQLFMPGEAIEG